MSTMMNFCGKTKPFKTVSIKKILSTLEKLAPRYEFNCYQKSFNSIFVDYDIAYFIIRVHDKRNIDGFFFNSIGGPGLHKEFIEFFDELINELNLVVLVEDGTGYYENRNFYQLQNAYMNYLKYLLSEIVDI